MYRISSAFGFARFHGFDNERIELQMGTTPHNVLDPSNSSELVFSKLKNQEKAVEFENQTYGTCMSEEKGVKVEQTENMTAIENPMFQSN